MSGHGGTAWAADEVVTPALTRSMTRDQKLLLPKGDVIEASFFSRNLDDAAIARLAAELASNTNLKKLDLDYNRVGVEGAKALAMALEQNTTLEKLYLDGNAIGPAGAAHLASALEKNQTLRALNIGHNQVGPTGAATLAASIKHNHSLQWLNLNFNHLGKKGAPHLKTIEAKLDDNTQKYWGSLLAA